jgi:hypothetical protein
VDCGSVLLNLPASFAGERTVIANLIPEFQFPYHGSSQRSLYHGEYLSYLMFQIFNAPNIPQQKK